MNTYYGIRFSTEMMRETRQEHSLTSSRWNGCVEGALNSYYSFFVPRRSKLSKLSLKGKNNMNKWYLKAFFCVLLRFCSANGTKRISITVLLTSMCSMIKLEEICNNSEDVPQVYFFVILTWRVFQYLTKINNFNINPNPSSKSFPNNTISSYGFLHEPNNTCTTTEKRACYEVFR